MKCKFCSHCDYRVKELGSIRIDVSFVGLDDGTPTKSNINF